MTMIIRQATITALRQALATPRRVTLAIRLTIAALATLPTILRRPTTRVAVLSTKERSTCFS